MMMMMMMMNIVYWFASFIHWRSCMKLIKRNLWFALITSTTILISTACNIAWAIDDDEALLPKYYIFKIFLLFFDAADDDADYDDADATEVMLKLDGFRPLYVEEP